MIDVMMIWLDLIAKGDLKKAMSQIQTHAHHGQGYLSFRSVELEGVAQEIVQALRSSK